MDSCSHTFAWHSVIPPSHCPLCGRCLGCGQGAYPQPVPIYPRPYPVWPTYPPSPYWYGTTISVSNTC